MLNAWYQRSLGKVRLASMDREIPDEEFREDSLSLRQILC